MAFDWTQLITPTFILGVGGGLGKLIKNVMNHKATENFHQQTAELKAVIKDGNAEVREGIAELKGSIEGGNKALVEAVKGLKN